MRNPAKMQDQKEQTMRTQVMEQMNTMCLAVDRMDRTVDVCMLCGVFGPSTDVPLVDSFTYLAQDLSVGCLLDEVALLTCLGKSANIA